MTKERKSLTARSVLLSVLLGSDPARLPVGFLVRTTELFGISEGTTRTALSRMAASGEVVADDGRYALAGHRLVARGQRQRASREARTRAWRGGRWRAAVLGTEGARSRDHRAAARDALVGARLAELREGVWLRPDNLAGFEVPEVAGARLLTVVPDDDPVELAATLWDLDGWASDADGLRRGMAALVGPLEAGDTDVLRDGFVLSAAVLRLLQHDPLLPEALLPAGWPGAEVRAEYDRYDTAYRRLLRRWFDGQTAAPPAGRRARP